MRKARPFLIISLPRSRSTWLSVFLTNEAKMKGCGHDMLVGCRSYAEFLSKFIPGGPCLGSAETAGMLGWKLFRVAKPEAKIILIRRDPGEVVRSLAAQGWNWAGIPEEIATRDSMLDAIAQAPRVKSYDYSDLASEGVCKELYEYCLEEDWNAERWTHLAATKIEIDLRQRAVYLAQNSRALETFKIAALAQAAQLGRQADLGLH